MGYKGVEGYCRVLGLLNLGVPLWGLGVPILSILVSLGSSYSRKLPINSCTHAVEGT